jgi:hypothetical protein
LNNQRVYRLMVTINGQQKAAYVRVGHWLLGLLHPVVVMRFKNVSEQSRATRTFGPSDSI